MSNVRYYGNTYKVKYNIFKLTLQGKHSIHMQRLIKQCYSLLVNYLYPY